MLLDDVRAAIELLESWNVDDPLSPFPGEDVVSLNDVRAVLASFRADVRGGGPADARPPSPIGVDGGDRA